MRKKVKNVMAVGLSAVMMLSMNVFGNISVVNAVAPAVSNPRVVDGAQTWDCVYFGNYYQSNSYEKEPIKWRVLSVSGNDMFLLSNDILDVQSYHYTNLNVTWEECNLRSWLNSSFLANAFSPEEQQAIKITEVVNNTSFSAFGNTFSETGNNTNDKIYLLETADILNTSYGFEFNNGNANPAKEAKVTPYAVSRGAQIYHDFNDCSFWWLRGKGLQNGTERASVTPDGSWAPYNSAAAIGIRPVLHLDASQTDVWSYAGTVDENHNFNAWVEEGIELNGYTLNNKAGGIRTIYTVTDTLNGKEVVEKGLIYGVGGYTEESDLYVGSPSEYVVKCEANELGPAPQNYSEELTTATSYRMTLKFASSSAKEFTTDWYVRAYAKLSDDTYVYTDVENYNIFDIVDYLYQNKKMSTEEEHNALYESILKKVDSNYQQVAFEN